MGAAAAVPAVLSLASAGLGAYGTMEQAKGTAAADTYQSEVLALQAQEGELKATQTNAQLTGKLNQTLGNIDAVRAASHTDPSSPTGAAVRNQVESESTNQKDIAVNSIKAQAGLDESQSAYLRNAASSALLSGKISAGAGLLKDFAGLPFGSMGLGGSGGATGTPLGMGGIGMA